MPSTVTTPVATRIPNQYLPAVRDDAARFGLSTSKAVAMIIEGALAERYGVPEEDEPNG